jgi:hypothetical protein
MAKSDLYRELLPAVNAGKVELLDHPRLMAQMVGLERRTGRGDDLANAAAGALTLKHKRVRVHIGRV